MNVVVVTFTNSDVPEVRTMLDLAYYNREEYCLRHGYIHCGWEGGDYWRPGTYYAIQRLQYVQDVQSDHPGHAVWVLNVSAVITDLRRPLDEWLKRPGCVHLCRDRNGLNAGSFLLSWHHLRNDWLSYIIARSLVVDHPWHEQHIIQETETHPLFAPLYDVIPAPAFNQYKHELYGWPRGEPQDWKPGDFAINFPGTPLAQRPALMREALAQVVR